MNKFVKKPLRLKKFSSLLLIIFIVLVVYSLSLLYPIFWGIVQSVKKVDEFRLNILGFPKMGFTFENFTLVIEKFKVPASAGGPSSDQGLLQLIWNTLLYVVGCSFFATFIPCITAYVTAKFPFRFSGIVYGVVLITMMIPIVGAYPSELVLLRRLGLYNTMYGIWIQRANFLGMYFLVFHASFKAMSKDFSEAAELDGASELTVMFKIMFPLVQNVFFTVFLIKFVEFWNDYQTPLLYTPAYPTLSYGVYYLTASTMPDLNYVPTRMAACIIVLIPILLIFVCFSEKLMGNISMGGVKE